MVIVEERNMAVNIKPKMKHSVIEIIAPLVNFEDVEEKLISLYL